ncbi:MAG TPA: DJ-1/PfpI family protein [Candidatus Hydrogenedens sp.]|nr:DJ-1/PfpI family protein [Candidatus Hydrogenedens sp.]HPP59698.1 DJ-1/PfpI family protein [Candidatus Hydrogenedens sp.]
MSKVLVLLAQGCEEVEAVTVIDLLNRAGVEVTTACLDKEKIIHASHGALLVAQKLLDEVLTEEFDMVVLPGGLPGADNLANNARVIQLIKNMANSGKYVSAICAAPHILAQSGLLDGKRATAYPGFLKKKDFPKIEICDDAVVVCGNIITGRGPGVAMDFALALIEALEGKAIRDKVEATLVRY